jgi:hypothetical protein
MASLGASISLVAGAALALLVVSFVFAYDGLSGSADVASSSAALRVPGQRALPPADQGAAARPTRAAVRIPTPPPRVRVAVTSPVRPSRGVHAQTGGVQTRPAPVVSGVGDLGAAPAPASSSPTPTKPAAGDGVRELGDSVSATVEGTGGAAGDAAAPLGPPVSQAVQNVLNLLDKLLKGATGGLAGTLDSALPR